MALILASRTNMHKKERYPRLGEAALRRELRDSVGIAEEKIGRSG